MGVPLTSDPSMRKTSSTVIQRHQGFAGPTSTAAPGRPISPQRKGKKLDGIQYLRAIAAFLVVVDHAAGIIEFPQYYGHQLYGVSSGMAGSELTYSSW